MIFKYLEVHHLVSLHDIGIQEFGGTFGIRDRGLLESAVAQPQQSFGEEDLFPTLFDKASAYAYYISENQPFLDGNKRVAISAAAVFLDINGYEIIVPPGVIYDVIMKVANKRMNREQLSDWFLKHTRRKKNR